MKRIRHAVPILIVSSCLLLASCGGGGRVNPDNSGAQLAFVILFAKRGLWR